MHKTPLAVALMLAVLAVGTPAIAQDAHVVGETELHEAAVNHAAADQAKRDAIRALLRRAEVREVAQEHGLDIVRAENAVASLQGPELNRIAGYAAQASAALAGGQDRIVLTTTTLIIILLIIILLLLL